MTSLLFVAFAAMQYCPKPNIVNESKKPFNQTDKVTLQRAYKRCGELYPESPCVKLFIKRTERDYAVICGRIETVR
jgi:hypothetical protein